MSNYLKQDFGKMTDMDQYVFTPEGVPLTIPGKLFLGEKLGLTSMEVSINKDAPGDGMPFFHRHKDNEEIYIFIAGKGEMIIDNNRFDVEEGSVVSVQPEADRIWRNTGDTDLLYIVVQAAKNSLKASGIADGDVTETVVPWG